MIFGPQIPPTKILFKLTNHSYSISRAYTHQNKKNIRNGFYRKASTSSAVTLVHIDNAHMNGEREELQMILLLQFTSYMALYMVSLHPANAIIIHF